MKISKSSVKVLALLLTIMLIFTLSMACSQGEDNGPTGGSSPPAGSEEPGGSKTEPDASGSVIGLENIKIGFIIDNAIDNGGWSQTHYEAAMRTKAELGLRDDQIVIMADIPAFGPDTENAIEMLVNEKCDLIIGCSGGQTGSFEPAAERHPDVYFAQFEGQVKDNYIAYTVRDYEAIFVAGYAAAKMSPVKELGFVAAQPTTSVVRAVNAWSAGAKYANPDATVQVVWSNSWFDPAVEKENSNSLLDSGIGALGYHGSTTAVMIAAQEHNSYATGFHLDMKHYAPKAVLTSFCWNWTPLYNKLITDTAEGRWTSEIVVMGAEEDVASLSPFNADIMPADVIADCEAVLAKMRNGEIDVFASPIYDNKGVEVLAEGQSFTVKEWMTMMYLGDNVIGDLSK